MLMWTWQLGVALLLLPCSSPDLPLLEGGPGVSGPQQVAELCVSPFRQTHSNLRTPNRHGYSAGGCAMKSGFRPLILPHSTASWHAENEYLEGPRTSCRRFQVSTEVLLSVLLGCSHVPCTCSAPALLQTRLAPFCPPQGLGWVLRKGEEKEVLPSLPCKGLSPGHQLTWPACWDNVHGRALRMGNATFPHSGLEAAHRSV